MNTDEAWNDTGDELALTPPYSPTSGNVDGMATKSPPRTPSPGAYHSNIVTLEVSPYPSHNPGGFRDGWNAREPGKTLGLDRPAAKLDGIVRGNHQMMRGIPLTQDGGTKNSHGRIGRFPHRILKSYRSATQRPGHFEVRNRGQISLMRLQDVALVKAGHGKRLAAAGSGFVKASVAGRGRESDKGGRGLGEGCLGWEIIQGYCNWLLDANGPRVRLFALLPGQ